MLKSTYFFVILIVDFNKVEKKMKPVYGYASTEKLHQIGLTDRNIVSFCQNGKLIKLKHGLYRSTNTFINNQNFIDVTQAMPYCVISRISALSFYELTTFIPQYTEVDIPLNYRRARILYPPVKINNADLYKFRKNVVKKRQGRYVFRIYDMEKTLCDCIKRRNSIGADVVREALKTYLRHPNKNIDKLFKIAKKCKISLKFLSDWMTGML